MPTLQPGGFSQAWSGRKFRRLLQAESLDEFARGCQALLQSILPHHSLRVSFNDLEFFRPSLIRDTLPVDCDVSYLFARNQHDPTSDFLRRHLGIVASSSRAQLDNAVEADSAEVFRDFMRREGWDKDAELYFWDDTALEAYLCVRRSPSQPAFSDDEMEFLRDLREGLGGCIHRLRNQHRERLTADCLKVVVEMMPVPVLLLDWQLDPICFNPEARQLCAEWLHGARAARMFKATEFSDVPDEIVRACLEKKKWLSEPVSVRQRSVDRFAPPFLNVPHPSRPDLFAQVELIDARKDMIGMPHFLVRLQRAPTGALMSPDAGPSHRPALAVLSCLSPCEREIAQQVQVGLTNDEVARKLSKSVSTVKMQLQSIFRKVGVTNRTELAARMNVTIYS